MALVRVLLGNIKGPQGLQGNDGPEGPQGVAGADGANGVGVPEGGIDGQVVVKDGSMDYGTRWGNVYSKEQMDIKLSEVNAAIDDITSDIEKINGTQKVTLTTTWDGDAENGYTQSVTLAGMIPGVRPSLDVELNGPIATDQLRKEEWDKVLKVNPGTDTLNFTAIEPTELELTILVKGA